MSEDFSFIRHVPVYEFEEECLREIFDSSGKLIGVIHKQMMTREEIELLWPVVPEKVKE